MKKEISKLGALALVACAACAAIERVDPVVVHPVMTDCHNGHQCPDWEQCTLVQLSNGEWCEPKDYTPDPSTFMGARRDAGAPEAGR